MKGILVLELFGEDTRNLFKLYRKIFEACAGELGQAYFDETVGHLPPKSSWVAEITGTDKYFGLARSFLHGKMDYSKSNGVGSRGIFVEFILSKGKIYEVKSQVSWKNADRYFCTVGDEGEIIRLDAEDVYHGFGLLTKGEVQERKLIRIAEITGPDEKYVFARNFLRFDSRYHENEQKTDFPGYSVIPGHIYEVVEPRPHGRTYKYYCTINDDLSGKRIFKSDVFRIFGIPIE